MLHINEQQLTTILDSAQNPSASRVDAILNKARDLKRLSLDEAASLLSVTDPALCTKIFDTARFVKQKIYGERMVLFAPLYATNECVNNCTYCAFRRDNTAIHRRTLSIDEIKDETRCILEQGHKRILLVAGEDTSQRRPAVDYYVDAVRAIYAVHVGIHTVRRVNINCAPLSVEEFRKLKAAGIGTYQVFQETYHDQTYHVMHPSGPKSDPDNRIDAVDRAFAAGIDDVGIGVLYGLYDFRFETLALLMHIEHLEKKFGVGPHTISVPRIEPAVGVDFTPQHRVSDDDFEKIVAVLRLAVPYTGIILSTRETAELRDTLFSLGVSQLSAASKTSPKGYGDATTSNDTQFVVSDTRSLDEVVAALLEKKCVPSFCAACYRKERTGETFMQFAKPGTIKEMCTINALTTLKEYLDDFASPAVREKGYALIDQQKQLLNDTDKKVLENLFTSIDNGKRDLYV